MAQLSHSVSVVVFGNKGCGKSTVCGRILYRYGEVADKTLRKAKDATKKFNKENSEFAFLCDKNDSDRKNGAHSAHTLRFDTGTQAYTMIDACGGEANQSRLIRSGLGQSRIAILILEAYKDKAAFDALVNNKSDVRKYLVIAHAFGLQQVMICINKIDKDGVNCDEKLYIEYCESIQKMLTSIGYRTDKIPIIPICSYSGDNLFALSKDPSLNWWEGFDIKSTSNPAKIHKITTLMKGIKYLTKKSKPLNSKNEASNAVPMVMTVRSRMEIKKVGAVFLSRIETGQLKVGQAVLCCKGRDEEVLCKKYTIQSMQSHGKDIVVAAMGDVIGFTVKGLDEIENKDQPQVGDLFCAANKFKMELIEAIKKDKKDGINYLETLPAMVRYVKSFTALIIILAEDVVQKQTLQLTAKNELCFRTQTIENCELSKIITKCRMKDDNLEVVEENKNELTNGDQAEVEFTAKKANFVSPYNSVNTYSRFVIMKNKIPIAIGKILVVNE